jgi:hypothetical protein
LSFEYPSSAEGIILRKSLKSIIRRVADLPVNRFFSNEDQLLDTVPSFGILPESSGHFICHSSLERTDAEIKERAGLSVSNSIQSLQQKKGSLSKTSF